MTAAVPHPDALAEYTRQAQERGCDPLTWAVQLSSMMAAAGAQLPSTELAGVLVSHLCWANSSVRLAWKYLDRALSAGLVPPVLVLALLSTRVIPCRKSRPVPYRLYLELLRMHAFSFASQIEGPYFKKIMSSVDDVLHLSQAFGLQACELGVLVVEFVFCVLWQLVDATIEDEGLQDLIPERKTIWFTRQDMNIDREANIDERTEHIEMQQTTNIAVATELIKEFLHHKVMSRLLSLARDNMPSQWGVFTLCLRVLEANSSSLPSGSLLQLAVDDHKKISQECYHGHHEELNTLIASESSKSSGGQCHGTSCSALWIPLDLYLEDCIDLSVAPSNAIEILSVLIKALQVVNGSTWDDVFLGLWMASLRLVQRERDPIEGPVPRLDSRLSMLLSITTLSVADVIEEEELALAKEAEYTGQWKNKTASSGKRRKALVSSLQVLGNYESLLVPPSSVVLAANQAAAKATMFVSGLTVGSGYMDMINMNDKTLNFSGNMWHLIVEACISRNLLDTSAYYWPGYVSGLINQIPHSMPGQVPGWSAFMKGAPLTVPMVNALVATPASSFAELEKVFEIAVSGSDDDKISAATILCGASLTSGWNVQEHTVRFALNLLSPPPPVDYSGSDSHLTGHGPVLYVVLAGISSVDCAQVFSYHGLVPELAGALMEISEVFGSYAPGVSWTLASGEEITTYAVFSSAFILLMRLWQFNHPPLECCLMGESAPVGSQLNPEYLLLQRNYRVLDSSNVPDNGKGFRSFSTSAKSASAHPIFVDSFPKLKVWYRQHQACLASTLSGLVHGTPVHKNVDALLNMMFRKVNKGTNQTGSTTSGSSSLSSSSGPGSEENSIRPKLPAWDIMEAVPFVVDAALTACAHGRLSPRELATGLKDLADFLPASLATIASYFSAEVTRGIWKPAFMNGTDWPSPAANLSTVEELIKKILAATGVDVPSLVVGGSSPATLPLPLAAFVSFTITYKLDKASERFLNLAGPALESLAASCPWPSMPIVAALWTQKVKRWSDFLIFSASRTVFHHNNDAVVQLLRSCFTAMLDLSPNPLSSEGGVGSLLGHGFGSHFSGGLSPVAPGVLYLRVYRCVKNVMILANEILALLMWSVKEIALKVFSKERVEKLKNAKYGMRYGQVSLAAAITQVRVAAALGATLVWLSGGPGFVQSLIHEILPSWFLSVHELDVDGASASMVHKLSGCALAHFAVIGGIFAWGIGSPQLSKRRPKVLGAHMEFIARAFDRKISVGCDSTLWRTYVVCFLGLVVECAPSWVLEIDSSVLKRLSWGLKEWDKDELALDLLQKGGVTTMGAAAEMIILAGE